MDTGSSSQEEAPALQVYWTPNLGCNIHVDLSTGVPEYSTYLKSASWEPRRKLRTVGDCGVVIYPQAGDREFPQDATVACLKLKPDSVPRHPGHPQDVTAYFLWKTCSDTVCDLSTGILGSSFPSSGSLPRSTAPRWSSIVSLTGTSILGSAPSSDTAAYLSRFLRLCWVSTSPWA